MFVPLPRLAQSWRDFGPTLVEFGPMLVDSGPFLVELVDVRPNSAQLRQNSDRVWSIRFRQTSGRVSAMSGQILSASVHLWADSGQVWWIPIQCWSIPLKFWTNLTDVGSMFDPFRAEFGQTWSKSVQTSSIPGQIGRSGSKLSRVKSAEVAHARARARMRACACVRVRSPFARVNFGRILPGFKHVGRFRRDVSRFRQPAFREVARASFRNAA